MTLSAVTQSIGCSYNALGLPTSTDRPGVVADTTYTYDAANRLTSMVHSDGVTPLLARGYGLDAVGNLSSESVSGPLALDEPLPDPASLSYNKASQVTRRNSNTFSYDADGNLTSISGGQFAAVYSPENRPSQITRLNNGLTETIQYTYNAAGMRVKRTMTGGATTQFHYGPGGQLLFTTDGAGNVTVTYVWKGSTLIAILTGANLNTDLRYPLFNHLGSVVAVLNPSGAADTSYAYQPYGGYFRQVNGGSADPGLFTFVGGLGVEDEGAGLFYMRNRFYDATTGRFLQRDPIGIEGGINLYAYANGNPMSFVDPAGLDPFDPILPRIGANGATDCRRCHEPTHKALSDEELAKVAEVLGKSVKNWVPYTNFTDAAYDAYNKDFGSAAWNLTKGVVGIWYGVPVNAVGQIEILAEAAGVKLELPAPAPAVDPWGEDDPEDFGYTEVGDGVYIDSMMMDY